MILRRLTVAALLACFAFAASAQQGPSGKWNGSVPTEQGPFALTFEFAVDGSTLTGNMANEFMGATPIADGTVKGNDVAFVLKISGDFGNFVINYTGTVAGDEMKLKSKFEGAPPGGGPAEQELVLTRAK